MKKINFFKKLAGLALIGSVVVFAPSCKKEGCTDPLANNYDADAKKDDNSCTYDEEVPTETAKTVTGDITSNTTWTKDIIYTMQKRVVVRSGATLTIEAGTIIKGDEGQGLNAAVLVVERGGKLMANGTAAEPIIFTTVLDDIKQGETTSTLTKDDAGKWGGVVILGKAPISGKEGDGSEARMEGLTASEDFALYGGSDKTDNSGVLKYVSIRFGGTEIETDNEINGLTLGGVGSGTVIENIEVVSNLDDGIEFFGGTVNVKNALVAFQSDDGIDIDQNYAGTVDNFVVIHGGTAKTDEALEIDGPENTLSDGKFTLKNGYVKTLSSDKSVADIKDQAQGTIDNVWFEGYAGKAFKFRSKFGASCALELDSYKNLEDGELVISNSEIKSSATIADIVEVYAKDAANESCTDALESTAEGKVGLTIQASSQTISGADKSAFSWTWASENNHL